MSRITAALLLVAAALTVSPLDAQQLRGRVIESETLAPVADATVSLLDDMMAVRARTRTDFDGTFVSMDSHPVRISFRRSRTADSARFLQSNR